VQRCWFISVQSCAIIKAGCLLTPSVSMVLKWQLESRPSPAKVKKHAPPRGPWRGRRLGSGHRRPAIHGQARRRTARGAVMSAVQGTCTQQLSILRRRRHHRTPRRRAPRVSAIGGATSARHRQHWMPRCAGDAEDSEQSASAPPYCTQARSLRGRRADETAGTRSSRSASS
jgi:hypothetical protein